MNNNLLAAGRRLAARAAHALEHHPKHITALLAAALLGGGGGAFAVASFGPDAADVPVREVVESVVPLDLASQAQALDLHALRLFRTEGVRSSDTVDTLFARLGLSDAAAAAFVRGDTAFRSQVLGRTGRQVTVEANDKQGLERLTARWTPDSDGTFRRLVIERGTDGRFTSRVETAALVPSARLGSGTIRTSLFAAVDDARIPDEIAIQVADILGGRVDFHRGLRKGDRFSVVYETLEADGEPMRTGRVLSVQFVNNGTTHDALWFQEAGKKGAYYSLDGKTLQSVYLASPMEFSRVTSGFAMRFHPVLQTMRAHLGVDYGAPTGTPVRTVGDGQVEFAGRQGGYGNVVIIKHNGSDSTLYAHLSRIDVRAGQKVTQGQRVGAVGSTGMSTGPHLHFEFRVNGRHQDPLTVARRAEGLPLSAEARPAFDKLAGAMRLKLEAAAGMALTASIE
ncbi:M23 family metallopeptidase [Ramlibacter sp. MAHUQ-53]|uniref:M23 family metallopeptidase n=1 Tax=unclassified Ramlibacter TaxID=2617605 RepID=UPI0036345BA2